MNRTWKSAPRDVDLLSWFTGPLVPTLFGGIAVVFGTTVTLVTAITARDLILGVLSVAIMVLAFVAVGVLASPRRANSSTLLSMVPLLMGWSALLVSLAAEWGSSVPFEVRWAPIGFALLLASLCPYVPVARILLFGILSIIFVAMLTAFALTGSPHLTRWPFVIQLVLGTGMVVVATAASTVFSYQVVGKTQSWATSARGSDITSGVLGEAARRRILRQELSQISNRALPLLQRITAARAVTPADRTEAAALSVSLRSELVERSNRSWLDSLAGRMNLTVIDHDRLAEKMDPTQRNALLGLLTAATKELSTTSTRLVIELRGENDGSTAVAISADLSLPEGRKLTMFAPYYVTLVAAVDDVEWSSGSPFRLRFRVSPHTATPHSATPPRNPPTAAGRSESEESARTE